MKSLSVAARIYILGMIVAGGASIAWFAERWTLTPDRYAIAAALGLAAALAQVLKVEGSTRKSSYNLSLVPYALALVLLGPAVAAAVLLVACVVDWVWHRYPYYIQLFNIGALFVALIAASGAAALVPPVAVAPGLLAVTRLGALVTTFVLLNHLFVGIVIYLARGEGFRESGVFGWLTVGMDASLFGLGAAGAYIWTVNPWASLLVAPPLALLYFSLRIPMLQRQAVTDPKTGLYNARYFNDALKRELERAERYERPLTVVMADLDLLRNINNKYGHVAGDIVLKGVADLLRTSVREYDVVARFGGEEFAVLMGETTMAEAERHLEKIRAAIESAGFEVPTSVEPINVTMSFGVAQRSEGESIVDLIHLADLALYQAKLDGRNRVRVAAQPNRAADTPAAIAARGFEVHEELIHLPVAEPSPLVAIASVAPEARPEALHEVGAEHQTLTPPQPMWMSEALIVFVAIVAAGMMLVSLGSRPFAADWLGIAVLAAVVFAAELSGVDIRARDASVSTSVVPFVVSALLFGPHAVAASSVAAAFGAFIKHRSQASRFVFNTSTHIIAGLAAAGAARMLVPAAWSGVGGIALGAVIAGQVVYLVTTSFISLAIALSTGQRPYRVWAERFSWLGPHYLALSLVATASILGYQRGGLLGAVLLMCPMLVLRFGQEQYLEHTREIVDRLRTTNAELERRTERIDGLNRELLVALTNMVELRDPYMLGHSQHVASYAGRIAERMGLPEEVRQRVSTAGLLHDIGKLGIPEALLLKESRLDDAEFEVVRRHTGIGGEIVSQCSSLCGVVSAVRHHHERYDGHGYPDHLRGEQIPLEARILAVADAVEAMASDRPYRHGMAPEAIIAEVEAKAGTQFDPVVADVFVQIVAEEGHDMIVNSALKVAQAAAAACDPSRLVGPASVAAAYSVPRAS